VAEEWRANIAYRQAVTDRLQREAKDSRDAKSSPSPLNGRRRRASTEQAVNDAGIATPRAHTSSEP
jgi:hypothetical protein